MVDKEIDRLLDQLKRTILEVELNEESTGDLRAIFSMVNDQIRAWAENDGDR